MDKHNHLQKALTTLGFKKKEIMVYLALLEYGCQPASVISKKVSIPKSSVLFLLGELQQKGIVQKSMRGKVQYFFAEVEDLQRLITRKHQQETKALAAAVPLLKEYKHPFSSPPKVSFFEGLTGCKKAYRMLLESSDEILEFGAHADLAKKFGDEFMQEFIADRVKRNVSLRAITENNAVHAALQKVDDKSKRAIKLFDPEVGNFYSSIAIFEDKILLLNLHHDAFAILIQNPEVAITLRTIFELAW